MRQRSEQEKKKRKEKSIWLDWVERIERTKLVLGLKLGW